MKRIWLFAMLLLVALTAAPAFAQTAAVTLAWDPSADHDYIAGYRIYYGPDENLTSPRVELGKVKTYTFPALAQGRWCFAATAWDKQGLESVKGNMVCEVIKTELAPPGSLKVTVTVTVKLE